MLLFLIKGALVGAAIAVPVGPIGVLCIQRSLEQGYKWGFITGMGAATADMIYGSIAGFGLTSISNLLLAYRHLISIAGGVFLLYFGCKILFSKLPAPSSTLNLPQTKKNLWAIYLGSLFLNLTSPITILLFISIFSSLGMLHSEIKYWQTSLMVLGILFGSTLWWLILSGGISCLLRHRIKQTALISVRRGSGVIILLFAAIILYR